jgi:hypothetical protein
VVSTVFNSGKRRTDTKLDMDDGRPRPGVVAFVVIAVALMLLFDASRAATACSQDTSYCAATTEKNGLYTGTLRGRDHRPAANTKFEVVFASRGLERPRVTFTSDARGRFCILWPEEAVFPSSDATTAHQGANPRAWLPLDDRPPPRGCQEGDAGVPWQRAKDLASSWQFFTLVGLSALALALLVAGAANWWRRGRLWARLAVTLTAVALLAHVWLWAP